MLVVPLLPVVVADLWLAAEVAVLSVAVAVCVVVIWAGTVVVAAGQQWVVEHPWDSLQAPSLASPHSSSLPLLFSW